MSSPSKVMTSRSSSAAENSISDLSLLDAQIALLDASASIVPDPNTSSSSRTADDVWRDIVSGKKKEHFCLKEEAPDAVMTLEDFLLAKSGVGGDEEEEEDVKVVPVTAQRRRGVLEAVDKAAQQRQRRMIKNRESAARSRERKQAYQVELESLAVRLEEEHGCLVKEKAERAKKRLKQLMEKVIPVDEKPRSCRVLRRVRSLDLEC